MSWKSFLFRDQSATAAKQMIREAKTTTDEVLTPIAALSIEMVAASWKCCEALKPEFRQTATMKHPEYQSAYVFFTLLSFSFYWVSIHAFNHGLRDVREGSKLKEILLLMIITPQIETFFGDPPDKAILHKHLYDTLNAGDNRYAKEDFFEVLRGDLFPLMNRSMDDVGAKSAFEVAMAGVFLPGNLHPDRIGGLIQNARSALKAAEAHKMSLPDLMREFEASRAQGRRVA
jgi:hypothetical protein